MSESSFDAGTCAEPFEVGGRLCRVCRQDPVGAQGRRCSRMVVQSPAMKQVLEKAATVANTDASVVIRGESGSGKEVLARALHANSTRKRKPFVAVNCAALPAELLESELFGHARGAFTGAVQARRGLFETANEGTLLLDEIAEMPLALQAKLLRVLQDGEVRRVGESQPVHVDVRVICATHQNLTEAVRARSFREDLYYRLKVFTLVVPPLRERKEDIPLLAQMFLVQERHATGAFSRAALAALCGYSWPGNVRELANAVKHGAVLSKGEDVELKHLPEELLGNSESLSAVSAAPGALETLAETEKRHVLRVFEACHQQQQESARVLGIGRTTLWRKLKDYGVEP
jgi:two-component system response regulator HydG